MDSTFQENWSCQSFFQLRAAKEEPIENLVNPTLKLKEVRKKLARNRTDFLAHYLAAVVVITIWCPR